MLTLNVTDFKNGHWLFVLFLVNYTRLALFKRLGTIRTIKVLPWLVADKITFSSSWMFNVFELYLCLSVSSDFWVTLLFYVCTRA